MNAEVRVTGDGVELAADVDALGRRVGLVESEGEHRAVHLELPVVERVAGQAEPGRLATGCGRRWW